MFRATQALLLNLLGYITISMASIFHHNIQRAVYHLPPLFMAACDVHAARLCVACSRLVSAHAVLKIVAFFSFIVASMP